MYHGAVTPAARSRCRTGPRRRCSASEWPWTTARAAREQTGNAVRLFTPPRAARQEAEQVDPALTDATTVTSSTAADPARAAGRGPHECCVTAAGGRVAVPRQTVRPGPGLPSALSGGRSGVFRYAQKGRRVTRPFSSSPVARDSHGYRGDGRPAVDSEVAASERGTGRDARRPWRR